jgi:hypothetical protein
MLGAGNSLLWMVNAWATKHKSSDVQSFCQISPIVEFPGVAAAVLTA